MKKQLKENDKEPKFHSVHRTSTFDATFGRWYANYLPLSTKKIQSILGKEKVSVFHVGNAEYERDIQQVQRIVGKKGTLSTFTSVDKGEKLAKGKGIQSGGGVIYQIEGTLLVASTRDMQSMPDNTGRRWIAIQDLAGKTAGSKMYKELKSAVEKNKMDRRSWDKIENKEEDKWMKEVDYYGDDYEGGYARKEKELKKIMGPLKRKWIKDYIDMGYKIIDKYKPQIKRNILSQKDKPSQHGWNEILVNQIKIKDVFLLKRSDYPSIRKAIEKIATGKLTVGSPAQFRSWYNKRGGIINESFFGLGTGIAPSPSRKGVEKMKKKGNTSVPYGSGYKKLKESKITLEQIQVIRDNLCIHCGTPTNENLKKWFSDKWVNIGKKDKSGKHPACGTSGNKRAYAKCVPASKARGMSKKDKESATRRKRAAQNKANRGGKKSAGQGKAPIRVSTKPKK